MGTLDTSSPSVADAPATVLVEVREGLLPGWVLLERGLGEMAVGEALGVDNGEVLSRWMLELGRAGAEGISFATCCTLLGPLLGPVDSRALGCGAGLVECV